jgi:hypothetical protein
MAAEARLLDEIAAHRRAALRDRTLLARPLRVLVPSRSLRRHVGAVLARRLGPALLGVVVQTLHGFAQELVAAADTAPRPAGPWLAVFALRAASSLPALGPLIDGFDDGHRGAVGAVEELIDAGLDAAVLPAALDCLADERTLGDLERDRVRETLLAAVAAQRLLAERGLDSPAGYLRKAADALAGSRADTADRARIVYGFSESTGLVADLLDRLARRPGTTVILDVPPDPTDPSRLDPSMRRRARLRERLGVGASPELWSIPARLSTYGGDGDADAHETARQIADDLDAGVPAEAIGIVGPELARRAAALRRELDRFAIPYSGLDLHAPDAPEAQWRALPSLLHEPARFPLDRFVALLGNVDGTALSPLHRAGLRLAFRAEGLARLGQLTGAEAAPADPVRLPGSLGLSPDGPIRPSLPRAVRDGATRAGVAVLARIAAFPAEAGLAHWRSELAALCGDLGHEVDLLPPDLPEGDCTIAELLLLLSTALASRGRQPIGGEGGGVQLLTPREARGRTWDRLYLLGAERDPPPGRDPLLSQAARAALRAVLPDLSLLEDRADEQRLLFAWFLSSAPVVGLAYRSADLRGRAIPVPPALLRLRTAGRLDALGCARGPSSLPLHRRAPLRDHVVAIGLWGRRDDFRAAMLATGPEGASLLATWEEVDGRAPRRGPYLGELGRVSPARTGPLPITEVEARVRCPWQAFLERRLGVAEPPDPLDSVPAVDGRVAGTVLHAVLERIAATQAVPRRVALADALARPTHDVHWPDDATLAAWTLAEAERALRRDGLRLPGLAEMLAERLRAPLAVARDLDFRGGSAPMLAVEVEGTVTVDGRRVGFRADRADRLGPDIVLTDYKLGRPFSRSRTDEGRRADLAGRVARGKSLQAAAYAAADGAAPIGRFVFLDPDESIEARTISLSRTDDDAAQAALFETLRTVLTAADEGIAFPRLVEPSGRQRGEACAGCEVRAACVEGDSTARGRLRDWAEGARARDHFGALPPADLAMLALFSLPGRS